MLIRFFFFKVRLTGTGPEVVASKLPSEDWCGKVDFR